MSSPASCAICAQPAKYTCPRCHTRTCSLPCTRTHKSTTACSGVRDRAAFVPLKDYGYGKLMDDYVFLEEGKRRAEGWEREITGMKMAAATGTGQVPAKVAGLKRALGERGIQVDFLSDGMEKRRKNQSHYNTKTHLIQLSMVFKYASPDPSSSTATAPNPTHQMQNIPLNETTTLHKIYTHQARKIPPFYPPPADPSVTAGLVFAMPVYQPSGVPLSSPTPSTSKRGQRFYPPFSPTEPLESVLKGTSFLEFPTVHVFLREDWERRVADGEVVVDERRGEVGQKQSTVAQGRETSNTEPPNKKPRMAGVPIPTAESSTAQTLSAPPVTETSPPAAPEPAMLAQPEPRPVAPTESQVAAGQGVPQAVAAGLALDYGTESDEGA